MENDKDIKELKERLNDLLVSIFGKDIVDAATLEVETDKVLDEYPLNGSFSPDDCRDDVKSNRVFYFDDFGNVLVVHRSGLFMYVPAEIAEDHEKFVQVATDMEGGSQEAKSDIPQTPYEDEDNEQYWARIFAEADRLNTEGEVEDVDDGETPEGEDDD